MPRVFWIFQHGTRWMKHMPRVVFVACQMDAYQKVLYEALLPVAVAVAMAALVKASTLQCCFRQRLLDPIQKGFCRRRLCCCCPQRPPSQLSRGNSQLARQGSAALATSGRSPSWRGFRVDGDPASGSESGYQQLGVSGRADSGLSALGVGAGLHTLSSRLGSESDARSLTGSVYTETASSDASKLTLGSRVVAAALNLGLTAYAVLTQVRRCFLVHLDLVADPGVDLGIAKFQKEVDIVPWALSEP